MEVQDRQRSPSSSSTGLGPGPRHPPLMAVLLTKLPSSSGCQSSEQLLRAQVILALRRSCDGAARLRNALIICMTGRLMHTVHWTVFLTAAQV